MAPKKATPRLRGRAGSIVATVATMLALFPPIAVGPAGPGGAGSGSAGLTVAAATAGAGTGASPTGTVTLLTGDRVTLQSMDGEGGRVAPHVDPAPGREDVRFDAYQADGHVHVVPSDARDLLGSGQLDRRLFDVTALIASGYDDAHRSDIPLIAVRSGDNRRDRADADAAVAAAGAAITPLPAAGAIAMAQPKSNATELWNQLTGTAGATRRADLDAAFETVWLDGLRQPSLDVSVPQIGAPEAWAAGFTGAGVTVAVLDTGVDRTHPDLAGKVAASRNFTGEADDDLVGHGTHVASTIVGSGAASGGRYRGVAPDATLLSGKVCSRGGCPESAMIAGAQWAVDAGARVVNLSVGGPDTPEIDPVEGAVDRLSAERGTLFVVAAGNAGPDEGTVESPASATGALAVGAVDDGDQVAEFSSRGPRLGDGGLKPEVTAPGVGIVAARARHGSLGDPADDGYASMSGTSMATPHVAGAAALLAQQHPGWDGGQIEASLVGAARPTDGTGVYDQGAGRIDVARAVHQEVLAEPAVVSAGRPAWPHHDDEPVTRTVTYRNPGAQPLSLTLALRSLGPDGAPAPDGMFTLSATSLSLPAGGQAAVDVTIDTRAPGPAGGYGAWIMGTDAEGQVTVTTPVAVEEEPESYDLTIEHRDAGGQLTALHGTLVLSLDQPGLRTPRDPDGRPTVRLPRGRYHVETQISTPADDGGYADALLMAPLVDLTDDTTIVLDARQARPLEIQVRDHPEAVLSSATLSTVRSSEAGGTLAAWAMLSDLEHFATAQVGPSVGRDELVTELQTGWGVPDADGELLRSPRTYQLAWYERGRMMTGATHVVRDRSLTKVRSDLRTTGPGRAAIRWTEPRPAGQFPLIGSGRDTALPIDRVELFTAGDVEWATGLTEVRLDDPADPFAGGVDETHLETEPVAGRPGQTRREHWNGAPLGPMVSRGAVANGTCSFDPVGPSSRHGDDITVDIPLLSDDAGHPGCPLEATGHTTLHHDGTEVGSTDTAGRGQFTVPAAAGTYRLEVDALRPQAALSTRVTAAWTFRSSHVSGDRTVPLPLMAVRFRPQLDEQGQAPGGRRFDVPFTIDVLGGAGRHIGRGTDQPTVEVSYDDGTTWAPAPVRRHDNGSWKAILDHPPTGAVSLRTTVADRHGNQVEQTIVRAYHLGG
jgi:subtilisin family serine protease